MKNIIVVLVAFLCLSSFTEKPTAKKKVTANTELSTFMYGLHHPLHSFESTAKEFKCIGVYNEVSKELEVVAVSVPVKNFDSGNSNRDSRVIETLEALKHPNITFSAQDVSYSGNKVTAKGKLVFHGESKPFTITGEQVLDGTSLSIKGKFDVNMTEFGVKPPSLMGMSTDEEIKVSFDFKFEI
ncbi:MAG: polyisoprenoid-binding protein YceI [Arcticibacterium sp.]|jgi:polyisoprenoid-binding protein YceI